MNNRDISIPKTRENYNLIAQDFSSRRQILTPDFKSISRHINHGDKILDFGCGDGRFLKAIRILDFQYLGVDISSAMIDIARKQFSDREFSVLKPGLLNRYHNYFDKIFSIAVFHHIPQNQRLKTLNLLLSCLKPGGSLLLTVWQANPTTISRKWTKISDDNDYLVPYTTKDNITVNRYIHLYSNRELTDLLRKAGFTNIRTTLSHRGSKVINNNIVVQAIKSNHQSN